MIRSRRRGRIKNYRLSTFKAKLSSRFVKFSNLISMDKYFLIFSSVEHTPEKILTGNLFFGCIPDTLLGIRFWGILTPEIYLSSLTNIMWETRYLMNTELSKLDSTSYFLKAVETSCLIINVSKTRLGDQNPVTEKFSHFF